MTNEDMKKYCIDNKLCTKKFTKNPRIKYEENEKWLDLISGHFSNIPVNIVLDIIFNLDGKIPVCKYCSKDLDFNNLSNNRKISYYHPECKVKDRISKIDFSKSCVNRSKTNIERYGTNNFVNEYSILKAKNTKFEKYGNENYVNIEKAKETKLQKYGNENYRNNDKIIKTNIERYGVSNPFSSNDIIEKSTITLNERYGGRGLASSVIAEKIKSSNIERYGVDNIRKKESVNKRSVLLKQKNHFTEEVYDSLINKLDSLYNEWLSDDSLTITKLSLKYKIDKRTLLQHFKKSDYKIYRKDNKIRSSGEREMINIIKSIDENIVIKIADRSILDGKEIDIWLPEYNLGIEYNGSYWHREEKVGDKHFIKTKMAKDKGIHLMHIFDFDLENNYDKIKDIIRTKLGKNTNIVYARKCKVKEIDYKEVKEFCNLYHIQGYAKSSIKLGLFYNDELIQIMTFGKPRFNKNYQYELIRLCNKANYTIIGGSEKIYKFFINNYNVKNVISYCDSRFFDGFVYNKIGMHFIKHLEPSYFWSNGVDQISRYKSMKFRLVNEGYSKELTEDEIMYSRGYYKILDSGQYVFSTNL
jgi:hypothetical protein